LEAQPSSSPHSTGAKAVSWVVKIVEVEEIEYVEVPHDRVVEYIVERIVEVGQAWGQAC